MNTLFDHLDNNESTVPNLTRVRSSDPDTSKEAALALGDQTVNQQRVLYLFQQERSGSLTDFELLERWIEVYGTVAESTPRKRRCDLVKMGRIDKASNNDGSVRKRLINGRNRIVWKLVQ